MRKVMYALSAMMMILIIAALGGVGGFFYYTKVVIPSSRGYLNQALPILAASATSNRLVDMATPEMGQKITPEVQQTIVAWMDRLGTLVDYDLGDGHANVEFDLHKGIALSADFTVKANFANGTGVYKLTLRRRSGEWRIDAFAFDPTFRNRVS